MAWESQSKTLSLFSSQPSKSPAPLGKIDVFSVFYKILDKIPDKIPDVSKSAYINVLLNPCSNPNLDLSKPKSALLKVDANRVLAQKWLLGFFSKALDYHHYHDDLLFVDRIEYTIMSWYSKLIDMYKLYVAECNSKSVTPEAWNVFISSYFGELLDLFATWLIYAIEKGYSHGHLLECIYFLDLSSPKLMISDGFDTNSRIDCNTNPTFYQVDLNAFWHVLFVIANHRPVDDLLRVDGYDHSSFEKCIHQILLKPSFIRPLATRIKYFYDLHNYLKVKPQEKNAFNNLGWSWLAKAQSDHGLVGRFYIRSTKKTVYQDNSDVLRFFRNADQHMIYDLKLGSQGFTQEDILKEFDQSLGFSEMIDEKVHAHATQYVFKTIAEKEAFIKIVGV